MRKPKLKIEPTGIPARPYWFCVKWPGHGYLNKPYRTFNDALKAIERRLTAKAKQR